MYITALPNGNLEAPDINFYHMQLIAEASVTFVIFWMNMELLHRRAFIASSLVSAILGQLIQE
jgi:hypothetical protein